MSDKSNNQGRAYEYICLLTLNEEINKDIDELNDLKRDLKEVLAPSKMSKFLGEERLSISLSAENYCVCDPQEEKNLLSQTVKIRQALTQELGYIIPKVQFIENFTKNIYGEARGGAIATSGNSLINEDEAPYPHPHP